MFDVIAIGDATLDTFLVLDEKTSSCKLDRDSKWLSLHFADKISIEHTAQSAGGNAANVAAGVSRLGFRSAIVTELGDDINGHVVREELNQIGTDTRFIKMHKGKETRYAIVLNYKSERTILSYHAPRKYTFPALPKTSWIYYTSLGKSFENVQKKLEQYLKKHPNTQLAMNPGSYQFAKGLTTVRRLLPRTTALFVNKEEAAKLLGKAAPPKLMLKRLQKKGIRTVVITDSTRGSFAAGDDGSFFFPAYPIKPIAKTGAGDAYASGFMGALLSEKSTPEAMQWGTANAGGVIQQIGAHRGLQTVRQLQKTVRKYKRIRPAAL